MPGLLVNVDVGDLDRGVSFYTAALGLRVGRRLGDAGVELLGLPAPLYLLARAPGSAPFPGAARTRDYRRHWTPVHLDVVVDDLEEALCRAETAGAVPEVGPTEYAWGRLVQLADPFGNGLCLLQFQGRGYDEIATAT
jgi:predicted enzyme related to lactoylglutathione lyase